MKKKIFTVFLTLCLVIGVLPLQAFAAAETSSIDTELTEAVKPIELEKEAIVEEVQATEVETKAKTIETEIETQLATEKEVKVSEKVHRADATTKSKAETKKQEKSDKVDVTKSEKVVKSSALLKADPYSIKLIHSGLNLGTAVEGYDSEDYVQSVTVTNDGANNVTLMMPSISNYDLAFSTAPGTLVPGQSITFLIKPNAFLTANDYGTTLTVSTVEGASVQVPVNFVVEAPNVAASISPTRIDFSTSVEGYAAAPAAKTVTIKNTGNVPVTLAKTIHTNFDISSLSAAPLAPGGVTTITIQPKAGLGVGKYDEVIAILNAATGIALGTENILFEVVKPTYTIGLNTPSEDFGSLVEGYPSAPAGKTVTVTNTGNTTITLNQPTSSKFEIGALSVTTLAQGATATFTIQPKKNLAAGNHDDKIVVTSTKGTSAEMKALFTVKEKPVVKNELISIINPSAVTVENGTAKNAKALGLPTTVKIKTTKGTVTASVTWNVESAKYDKNNLNAQKFNVSGTVKLPEGVSNTSNMKLVSTIQVNVKAYVPKVANTSENVINGIDTDNAYKTNANISFTAVGGGMDNDAPKKGDVRYIPSSWKINENNNFSDASYSETFTIQKAGTYTVTVTYDRQVYDGKNWVSDGKTDTKSATFKVTGSAVAGTSVTRVAVKTGDSSSMTLFIVLLLAAAACIIAIVVFRKKKA